MSNVRVISPDGRETYVKPEDLRKALKQGYKEADTAPVTAAAEGVMRGLTLGVSDEFLAGASGAPRLDPVTGQWMSGKEVISAPDAAGAMDATSEIARRKQENPIAAGAGNIAGSLLGVGRLTGLATSGKAALGLGLTEGGLMGLGSTVTEDALGDKDALGEKLLVNMGISAATGGAFGLGGFQIGKALSALGKKVFGAELPESLSSLNTAASTVRKIPYKRAVEQSGLKWEDIERIAVEEGIFTSRSTNDSVADIADSVAKKYGARVLRAEEAAKASAEGAPAAGREPTAFRPTPMREDLGGGGGTRVARPSAMKGDGTRAARPSVMKGEPAPEALDVTTVRSSTPEAPPGPSAFSPSYQDDILRMEAAAFIAANTRKSADGAGPEALRAAIMGGLFAGPVGAVKAGASSFIGSEVRARAPFLTAAVLEKMGPGVMHLARGLQNHIGKVLENAPEILGPFRTALTNAMSQGLPELLRTHVELASSKSGGDYLSAVGLQPEAPEDVEPTLRKLSVIEALDSQHNEVTGRLVGFIDGATRANGAPPAAKKDVRPWEERVAELRALVRDPARVLERLPEGVLDAAPATASGITAKAVAAAQFLLSKAPQDPYSHLPEPMKPRWQPSASELEAFEAASIGVADPIGSLQRAAKGRVRPETLEAIAVVYPRIFQEAREAIFARMSTKKLSYAQRVRLEPLMGAGSGTGADVQAAYIQGMHDKSKQPISPSGSPDGRQVVSTSKNMATQAVRMESRGAQV